MRQSNHELLGKFERMKEWMVEDTKRAMFDAKANFLVAQGLLNYTEIIGAFINPTTKSLGERFDTFFKRMGTEYDKLLKLHNHKGKGRKHLVYDDLRCGLTHEYVIKRKSFVVFNSSVPLTDAEINNKTVKINGN
jgi:hypothetical protein